ncbi:site-2 protease family protein [Paenibacillus xerothermodurans]|uniref:Site-2 protease family protein n=1 Tax=Paenibacillus xerothermodurans TaxID=1977292 RepID=A0A2W1P6N6_PAEXE|nr:site-2 protease family protein [Paenibacillus xerothermodurans]PZE22718.1 site-2 protease family protein [Paenibacillus xerothermodurans]
MMSSFLAYPLAELPFVFVVLMISFALHEFAHAYFADQFGDPTARSMGRLTLNPRVHIDWVGMIFFLIIGIGWAKPILVNRSYFRKPRLMSIIVSFAGPFSNLLLGFVSLLIFHALLQLQALDSISPGGREAVELFSRNMIELNIFLFILNLIPFPPLDGYRILEEVLPRRAAAKLKAHEQWLFYAILLMFFIPPIRSVTLGPIFALKWPIFNWFDALVRAIFGAL